MKTKQILFSSVLAACALPQPASATDGMNMEGYGATAMGMGGASMAYDNGTAAMMNNPATLVMMHEGTALDLAFGFLGPNVEASSSKGYSRSSDQAFAMPAVGWVRKQDKFLYGIGMYGQGGMGTEYGGNSIFSNPNADPTRPSPNLVNRSEVSVGRVILPLAYDVSPALKVGGSLDYVWAGMDMQMAVSGQTFLNMTQGSELGLASGAMVNKFGSMMGAGAGQIGAVNWGYFDFSNANKFTGQAIGTGYAGKIGFVYRLDSKTSIGATYHSKTRLGDLEADQAKVDFNVDINGSGTNVRIPVSGKIKVQDFQWPETFGIGLTYEASDKWMLAADYKRINWSDTMKDIKMVFTPGGNTDAMASQFNGLPMDVTFHQNWDDQNIFMFGAAYRLTDALTLRGGINVANNPVPDKNLNYLFPAIIKNHITFGAGYTLSKTAHFDLGASYVPKVTATSNVMGESVTTSHQQINWQLVYSYHY